MSRMHRDQHAIARSIALLCSLTRIPTTPLYSQMSTPAEKGKQLVALVKKLPTKPPDLAAVRALTQDKADLSAVGGLERTALSLAAMYDQFDLSRVLLDGGSNIHHQDAEGCTALHLAAWKGNSDMCSLLMGRKANIAARNESGKTALHYSALNDHVTTCEVLVDRGADIEAVDDSNSTSLRLAAFKGYIRPCEFLIERGAKLSPTLLHSAAKGGDMSICTLLLSKGANILIKNEKGATCLHRAASEGHTHLCRLFLLCGADASVKDNEGKTPLDLAREKDHSAAVEVLEGVQGVPPAPPVQALGKRKREVELEPQRKESIAANEILEATLSKLKQQLAEKTLALEQAEKVAAEASNASAGKGH